jgi:hypothetical protein
MRFPISLAFLGLIFSAAIGAVSVSQTPASQAQRDKLPQAAVAYRGSGRIQW